MGTLYLVSTPIGNLDDLSVRAGRVLGAVEAVLAEDTRRTRRLLDHLGVDTPLLSLHAHNEEARAGRALERLASGGELALVSDAGTPLVSDPGGRLVGRVLEADHRVVPLPGPSAVLAALVGSGLPTASFTFLGFPPRKGKERARLLRRVAASDETVVLFEAPGRTGPLLADLAGACGGDRRAAVARELTKVHEEFRRGTLEQLARYYGEETPRGEVTLVVAPREGEGAGAVDEEAARALALALLREGTSPSRTAREVARRLGVPRNRAYDLVQALPPPGEEPVASGPPSDAGKGAP